MNKNPAKYWDKALSLIGGCSPVSESCDSCWAAKCGMNWCGENERDINFTIILPFKLPTWNQLLAMNRFQRAKVTKWIKEFVSTSIAKETDLPIQTGAVVRLFWTEWSKQEYLQMIVPNSSKKYRLRKRNQKMKRL